MSIRHSPALAMAALVAWNSAVVRPKVLGVVVEANRAHPRTTAVTVGATVYDGDRYSTEARGRLTLQGGTTTLELAEASVISVRNPASGAQGIEAELEQGTILFSTARSSELEIVACKARVRPSRDGRTVAQISVTGPEELKILVLRGALQFSYGGEMGRIAEGKSYRVILDPSDNVPNGKEPPPAKRLPKGFKIVVTGEEQQSLV